MAARPIVAIGLGLAGLIPFLASTWAAVSEQTLGGMDAELVFISYSAVILSFLCGTLWGFGLGTKLSSTPAVILVLSSVIAIAAWAGLLIGQVAMPIALLLFGTGFFAVLAIELMAMPGLAQKIDPSYRTLRITLTSSVVAMHVLLAVL